MFIQSILVYYSLMLIMLVFAYIAIIRSNDKYYPDYSSDVVEKRSFFSFEIIFPLLLFSLIFGMRYDVGFDHLSYLQNYVFNKYTGKNEYLFYFFSDLGWFFKLHFVFYFTAISFFQIFFFFYFFKNERFLFPLLIFFLFFNGNIFFWMNGMRQALAMCIWLYSLQFLINKRFFYYCFFCILTFFIHKSSIILLLIYPFIFLIKDYLFGTKRQLLIFTSAFIIDAFFSDFILKLEYFINLYSNLLGADLYESYTLDAMLEQTASNDGTGLAYLFKIFLNFLIILYCSKMRVFFNSKKFDVMYILFFIGLIATYILPDGAISITRPFRYLYIFQPIIYSYFLFYLFKKRFLFHNYILFCFFLVTFLGLFTLSQYNAKADSHTLFQFYFEHNIKAYPN